MSRNWALLLYYTENWVYSNWLTSTNIFLVGLCFAFAMDMSRYYSTLFLHTTMNFITTVQGQHSIFIFLLVRQCWVKLESDTEELWFGMNYQVKVSIQILQNAYSLNFLKHLSRQYDDFMNHVNYFQYSLLTSIACLIWCMEKTDLSMHSTSVLCAI